MSDKTMKYLIIPDVHNRIEAAENLVKAMPGHHPVFLGDYFDSFHDTPEMAEATAKWLSWSISQGRTHLMGNHDLPYRWKHQSCPGYRPDKHARIMREMSPSDWDKVGLFKIIEAEGLRPLVLSHAGFTLANLYGIFNPIDTCENGRAGHLRKLSVEQHLEMICHEGNECLRKASYLGEHHWFNQGSRMGELEPGGLFWQDKDDFMDMIPGIDQIVGHSHVNMPLRRASMNAEKTVSEAWFIDGMIMFAATVDLEDNGVGGLLVTPIHATGEIGRPIRNFYNAIQQ